MSAVAGIGDHAMLSDCQTAALVDRAGTITWWCPQRFDAPSTFAQILDHDAGHWSITAVDGVADGRAYVDDTMVLRTRWRSPTGTGSAVDALDLGAGRGHDIGLEVPHAIVRRLEADEGTVEFDLELRPRPDYGRHNPTMRIVDGGVLIEGLDGPWLLSGPAGCDIDGGTVRARVHLCAGETLEVVLAPAGVDPAALGGVDGTMTAWRSWSDLHLDPVDENELGPGERLVRRSALVLQALTYRPTGAIVAAPTTSLPEQIGGESNWDYRYSWLRDTSLTMQALDLVTCADEVQQHMRWMAAAVTAAGPDGRSRIVFGIDDTVDMTEHRLDHLAGHRNSAPVRIGNDAWRQTQHDVTGEVLDAAWMLRDHLDDLGHGGDLDDLLIGLADLAAGRWPEPDSGIWEGREGLRHYVSSKVYCWVALDRAARLGTRLADGRHTDRWRQAADDVRADILANAWRPDVGAYTGAYGSDHLDASVLLLPLVEFLPADDPRMRATIEVIAERLTDGGLVVRWSGDDGRPAGDEGAFVICTCWLVQCLARLDDLDRARALFDRIVGCANDVGLFAEEIDRDTGELLGNHPQAFSHVGIITAAHDLALAAERARHHTRTVP